MTTTMSTEERLDILRAQERQLNAEMREKIFQFDMQGARDAVHRLQAVEKKIKRLEDKS